MRIFDRSTELYIDQNWREIELNDLKAALESIKLDNDPEAAKNFIEYFHDRFKDIGHDGCPIGPIGILCQYIEHAFEKMIVDNWTPEQALGLKVRRGKYSRPDITERDHLLTASMLLHINDGKGYLEAIGATANEYFGPNNGDKAVEEAYRRHKELFKTCDFSHQDLIDYINHASPGIKASMAGSV